jgi:hypothetical protein
MGILERGQAIWISALLLVQGCSSTFSATSLDASRYNSLTCRELNEALTTTSKELSEAAIFRGKVTQIEIPRWVIGGRRAAATLTERQTAEVEALQEQVRAIAKARDRNC